MAALVDPHHPLHPDILASLPRSLAHLDAGAAFDAVLSVAASWTPIPQVSLPARSGRATPPEERELDEAMCAVA